MFDHQHGDAQVALDVLDPPGHVVGFFDVQARRRLVQQQQLGLGTQRARQLHDLAHAVGQPGDQRVAVVLQAEEVDHLFGLVPRLDFGAARGTGEQQVLPQRCAPVRVAADQQVLQHAGKFEQLDVLEGARNAQRRHRVRRLRDQVLAIELDACRRWAGRCG